MDKWQYENEYQGVHTHSGKEDLGFSSILYLKVIISVKK